MLRPADTALLVAARNNLTKVLGAALAEGANPNAAGGDGYPALHLASWFGCLENVRSLCEGGADVNLRIETERDNGATPLLLASQRGFRDVVEYLLSHQADPFAEDKDGDTPFSAAEKMGQTEICALLKEYRK